MNQVIIHDLPDWRVISHGNGWAYELVDKRDGASIFFQDDDAGIFRDTLDALTEGPPQLSYSNALGCIWSDYAEGTDVWGIRS